MSSAVDEARGLLEGRLGDLDDERKRVENAIRELGGKVTPPRRPARRGPGRPKGSKASTPTRRRRGRGNTRADQAVKLIQKKPGISASDIAKAMKIKPNYLYRVLGDLEKEGRVKKDGRNYTPAA